MTKQERARQIDAEEFRRESEQLLKRALENSRQKQEAYRRFVLGLEQIVEPPTPKQIKANALKYTVNGFTLTINQWAKKLRISVEEIHRRAAGSSIEAVIARGPDQQAITYDGQTLTRSEWAQRLGISYGSLCVRISKFGEQTAIAMGTSEEARKQGWLRRRGNRTPGVGQNLGPSKGTDAGRPLQATPKITFSKEAITE